MVKAAKLLFLFLFNFFLFTLAAFLVTFQKTSIDRRIVEGSRYRIEIQKKTEATWQEIEDEGRRIDRLVVLNFDSTAFFQALRKFDNANLYMDKRWREDVYWKYDLMLAEFNGKYWVLNEFTDRAEKKAAATDGMVSGEKELVDLLAAKDKLAEYERDFSELSLRFEKLADDVFLGADKELQNAHSPPYLKLTNDRLEYIKYILALPW